jgi:hypothetical protein
MYYRYSLPSLLVIILVVLLLLYLFGAI